MDQHMSQKSFDALPDREDHKDYVFEQMYRVKDTKPAVAIYMAKPGRPPHWWHFNVKIVPDKEGD